MIKLKDLLKEDTQNLKPIAMSLLKMVKQKVGSNIPTGLARVGGIEVAWTTSHRPEIIILYDTPREVRHASDYAQRAGKFGGSSIETFKKQMTPWVDFAKAVEDTIRQFKQKYDGINFSVAGNIGGSGIKRSGTPRDSNFY